MVHFKMVHNPIHIFRRVTVDLVMISTSRTIWLQEERFVTICQVSIKFLDNSYLFLKFILSFHYICRLVPICI